MKSLGFGAEKNEKKLSSFSYLQGKKKAIAKRRANNKVARKARRKNRLVAGNCKPCCTFSTKVR